MRWVTPRVIAVVIMLVSMLAVAGAPAGARWRTIEAVAANEIDACRDGVRYHLIDWPGEQDSTSPPGTTNPIERAFVAFSPPPAAGAGGEYDGVEALPGTNVAYVDPVLVDRLPDSSPAQVFSDTWAYHWWFEEFRVPWTRELQPGERVIMQHRYLIDPDTGFETPGTSGQFSSGIPPTVVTVQDCHLFPQTVVASQDTYVDAAAPGVNHGAAPELQAGNIGSMKRTYLRFDVPNLMANPDSVRLRLHLNAPSANPLLLYRVPSTTWNEGVVTWNTKPALGLPVGIVPASAAGWVEVDLASVVSGPGPVSLAIGTPRGTPPVALSAVSSEGDPDLAPRLVIADDTPTAPAAIDTTDVSHQQVGLIWPESVDNDGVDHYLIFRDGVEVGQVAQSTADAAGYLTFQDQTVAQLTTYVYTLQAVDSDGTSSPLSEPVAVQTPITRFVPTADASVSALQPDTNFGTNVTLGVANTLGGVVEHAYLRFDVQGIDIPPVQALLRLQVSLFTSGDPILEIRTVADNTWGEETITWNTRPATSAPAATTAPITDSQSVDIDVTSLVTANGPLNLAITTPSDEILNIFSREDSLSSPQLIILFGDIEQPVAPSSVTATLDGSQAIDVSWTAATDNVGVTGYDVYRNGVLATSVAGTTTTYHDTFVFAGGDFSYQVLARDGSGNESALSAPSNIVTVPATDTIPPVVSGPASQLAAAVSAANGGAPVTTAWQATDDASGIDAFELERSTGGGPFLPVALPDPHTVSITESLAPGAHQYRARATDGAGNLSDWSVGQPFTVAAFQENDSAVIYTGTWLASRPAGFFGGGSRLSAVAGSTARLTFAGSGVAWISTICSKCGLAEIWLDGAKVALVDLAGPGTMAQQVVWSVSDLAGAAHMLEIRVLGAHSPASTANRVDLDAIVTLR